MQSPNQPRSRVQRWLATFLIGALTIGQAGQAVAASTALADVPIAAKVAAKPNIVYTVDDSGSMALNYIPDYVVGNYCRSGAGLAGCPAGNNNGNPRLWDPPFQAADFNHMAYNPNVTYLPPLKADGTPMTFNVGTYTDALGNQNFRKTQTDPYLAPNGFIDLGATVGGVQNGVNVPLYCNTDWPLDLTLGQADGSHNGEYQAGKGRDCRINGTNYDAVSASPAITAGYNYPWQNSVAPKGAQYFYQGAGGAPAKVLWCDTTNPSWPTAACAWHCTSGAATTTVVPQTWTRTGPNNGCCTGAGAPWVGCAGASTYNPPSCNTSPIYCSPGLGSPPECIGGCGCNNQQVGNVGTCSYVDPNTHLTVQNGSASCTTGVNCVATCPNVTITTGCTAGGTLTNQCPCAANNAGCRCGDPLQGALAGRTLLQDADPTVAGGVGSGIVCRHNMQAYGATPAGPVTYTTAALGGMAPWTTAVNSGCPTYTANASIPRHYYTVTSVQFCNGTNAVVNAQWRGFGTGACQSKNDFTTYLNVQYGTFTRVDLVNDGRTFAYTDPVTGAAMTRTYAQETTNYANWYAYYRTRLLAAKTTSSIAFSYLDDTFRVGFHNLGNEPPPNGTGGAITWVDVNDFKGTIAGTTRFDWYNALFNLSAPASTKTATISGMLRIGNLFQNGGAAGLPAGVNPLPVGAKDPITLSCQNNYHILFTDGFTNQVNQVALAAIGNVDNKTRAWDATIIDNPPDQVITNLRPPTLPTGNAWPKVFSESGVPVAVSDSLADIALYYWMHDLRPALKNDVPAASGKGGGDLDYTKDVAWWQHVNFNAISFGSDGILDASNQNATIAAIQAGTVKWPAQTKPAGTANPWQPTNPAGNPGASAADDLWHATVNARGQFVYAKSPIEVAYGLARILAGIQNQRKSRVGAAFAGQVLDATNNIIYETTVEAGWAGDVLKVQIDPATGAEVATLWQANTKLAAQIAPAFDGDEPWFAKRKIATINTTSGAAVPFLYSKLSAGQLASLSPDAVQQQKMIAYLRGGTTFGAAPTTQIEGTGIGQFRKRFGALGDITNAQAVIVDPPTRPYMPATDPGYAAFATAHAARSTVVFAAANDGMVHAIDAATGNEVYAFMPSAVFRGIAGAPATQDVTGIQAQTYQDGGVPIFHHHFYVDSSPRVADVDFTNGGGDWHTILVGGLGKGGNTYYALDVTDPSAPDENAVAGKVLWEWRNPDNDDSVANFHKLQSAPGYTYGRPVIVKTRAFGWTVIVTGGYNNKSGVGTLYFLNPKTGVPFKTMTTGGGSPANPAGLAQIHAFVKDFRNQVAEQVYGGDLLGNLWRFDVSDANSANWKVDLLAQLKDPGGTPQPITTAPQIEIDLNNGIDRFVFIGTGQLLDPSDLTNPSPPQPQTMYAIRDGTLAAYQTAGLPIQPRVDMVPINPDGVSAIVGGAPNGWYHDLPSVPPTAERIVVDVQADVNIAAYIGTQAPTDPCVISLPATLYARDYTTGRTLLESGGSPVASITDPSGAVGGTLVGRVDPVTHVQSLGWLLTKEIPGSQPRDIINPVTGPGNRLSWRLLTGQ